MQLVGHMLAMASEGRRDLLAECLQRCPTDPFDPLYLSCPANCHNTIHYERATSPTLIMFFDVS